ncbi:MAG: glycoside hydrolase family 3 C-terminal domain-containing protein [Lachnospiraceae bacterium]|nr:glycoside hydrolase family 3 C-terminal domain-containing protein [Lachnospiraceae bacterium]
MGVTLDWEEYEQLARQAAAEGCVLLENRDKVLPLSKNEKISIFGRIQNHYYKSGTGSGGMVNVSHVISIVEGLEQSGYVEINKKLQAVYASWEEEHPFNEGEGWGTEPWSQEEMELSEEVVREAATFSKKAIVILGRTAGEDRDASDTPGSFRLTHMEEAMLEKVRNAFEQMIVLLNVGSVVDMSFVDRYHPEGVMYVWQGGMMGGAGCADVLTGKVSPSGRMPDTIAYEIKDYPSHENFGDPLRNYYMEDIYVGYRYFETFAKEKVRYPFGYGLSYTKFRTSSCSVENHVEDGNFKVLATVENVGEYPGKEVLMCFVGKAQGKLGKPEYELVSWKKTKELAPGETAKITMVVPYESLASFDDRGVTSGPDSFVVEKGDYKIYVGEDVRNSQLAAQLFFATDLVMEKLSHALAPVLPMKRMCHGEEGALSYEEVPLLQESEEIRMAAEREALKVFWDERMEEAPKKPGFGSWKLSDCILEDGEVSLEDFVCQLTDEDLSCLIRGEGMGSSLVTAGTASAFGGVSKHLRELGIPAVCCDDGPSGMRLDSGMKAFSLPNGTMLASSFNTDLVEALYHCTGLEMVHNQVECLLGPGMNIHRHPLNGRNFEYFSEDPYVTGRMARAMLRGLTSVGVTGTIKHFCANNQEYERRRTDSVISARALREIYLKGFEMVVKAGLVSTVMTTYGLCNGLYTASNYDLNTTILRKEWGYEGVVMTDWWAEVNTRTAPNPSVKDYAAMIRAQNDLYMVCTNGDCNDIGDNTLSSLNDGSLTRGELLRSAKNICGVVGKSMAMKRLKKEALRVEMIHRPDKEGDLLGEDVEYVRLEKELTVELEDRLYDRGEDVTVALDVSELTSYEITLEASSSLASTAQLSVSLYYTGVPFATYTFQGGADHMRITKELGMHSRFAVLRFHLASGGLCLHRIYLTRKETKD